MSLAACSREMACPGAFHGETSGPLEKEAFSKAAQAQGYEVAADTRGTLSRDGVGEEEGRPLLIVTSQQAGRDCLAYLDSLQSRGLPAVFGRQIMGEPVQASGQNIMTEGYQHGIYGIEKQRSNASGGLGGFSGARRGPVRAGGTYLPPRTD